MDNLLIILLGLPASGKGTHGKYLELLLGISCESPGFHLRKMSDFNEEIREKLKHGQMVPEHYSREIVKNLLIQNNFSLIIDGYPRTIDQVNNFEDDLLKLNHSVKLVVYLDIPKEESLRRLSTRYVCETCNKSLEKPETCCDKQMIRRIDDLSEITKKRVDFQYNELIPVVEFYKSKDKLISVSGLADPESKNPVLDVSKRIADSIKEFFKNKNLLV